MSTLTWCAMWLAHMGVCIELMNSHRAQSPMTTRPGDTMRHCQLLSPQNHGTWTQYFWRVLLWKGMFQRTYSTHDKQVGKSADPREKWRHHSQAFVANRHVLSHLASSWALNILEIQKNPGSSAQSHGLKHSHAPLMFAIDGCSWFFRLSLPFPLANRKRKRRGIIL